MGNSEGWTAPWPRLVATSCNPCHQRRGVDLLWVHRNSAGLTQRLDPSQGKTPKWTSRRHLFSQCLCAFLCRMPMHHYDALHLLFHGPREAFDRAQCYRFLSYTGFIKLLHLAYLSSALRRDLDLDKTVGSRVWRHTQGSSGWPASDLGCGSSSKTAPGSLLTGSLAGRTLSARRRLNVQSGERKGRKVCCGPLPERCRPWSWTLQRCCGKRMGPLKGDSTESLLRVERWSPRGAPRKPVGHGLWDLIF